MNGKHLQPNTVPNSKPDVFIVDAIRDAKFQMPDGGVKEIVEVQFWVGDMGPEFSIVLDGHHPLVSEFEVGRKYTLIPIEAAK